MKKKLILRIAAIVLCLCVLVLPVTVIIAQHIHMGTHSCFHHSCSVCQVISAYNNSPAKASMALCIPMLLCLIMCGIGIAFNRVYAQSPVVQKVRLNN